MSGESSPSGPTQEEVAAHFASQAALLATAALEKAQAEQVAQQAQQPPNPEGT